MNKVIKTSLIIALGIMFLGLNIIVAEFNPGSPQAAFAAYIQNQNR